MLRRTFLKYTALISGVAVAGIPKVALGGQAVRDCDSPHPSSFLLFGNKAGGCALPRGYRQREDSPPFDIASQLS